MTTAGDPPPPLTATDIIRLAQTTNTTSTLPSDLLSPQILISHLRSLSSSSSAAVADYALALLSLISTTSPHSPLLSNFLIAYVELFNDRVIPHDSNSLKTMQLFVIHIGNVCVTDLCIVVDKILLELGGVVEHDDAQLVEMVPRCVELISRSNGNEKGGEFVDRIVNSSWSRALLVKFVSVMREFEFLDVGRKREFVEKVFGEMRGVDLQDVPALMYQLLVAASKGFCKRQVVERIVMFFGSSTETKVMSSAMRQVEGTVLLHVNFAVKQDPSLGQEVMGLLKNDVRVLSHFTLVVLLSIARIRRFSESCMRVLKTAVLSAYRDYKVSRNCKWIPEKVKKECLQSVKMVEKGIQRAANDSNYGREHVVPSIVQFGFLLLESADEDNSVSSDEFDGVLGVERLGIETLMTLFEAHDMSRAEIIDECKYRVLSLKPEQQKPIVRLLSFLVSSYPYPMSEHVSRLKDLLDYFTFMDGDTATHLISALSPLTKLSRDLQDYIIVVVSKAMFSREDTVQVSAINSVMEIIFAEKKSKKGVPFGFQDSSSQASCSQQVEIAGGHNADLFMELNGLLQRSLYQQEHVKEAMYHGLVKLVLVDPLMAGPILDFLLPHFLRFFQEDADVALNIRSCVKLVGGKICINEPLGCLLACVSWILLLQPHGKNDSSTEPSCFGFSLSQDIEACRTVSGDSFSACLHKIRKLLRNGQMEAVLGEVPDAGSASLGEEQKQCRTDILSGIVEVFLNSIAAELEKSADVKQRDLEKEILDFATLFESLQKDARQPRPGLGIRKGSSKLAADDVNMVHDSRHFLGTSSIYRLLLTAIKLYEVDCGDVTASQKHTQSSLSKSSRGPNKLISFLLGACGRHTKSSRLMGENDPTRSLFFGNTAILGPTLLRLLWLLVYGPKSEAHQQKKVGKGKKELRNRKDFINSALLCLKELMILNSHSRTESPLLEELLSIPTSGHAPGDVECEGYEWPPAEDTDNHRTKIKVLFIQKVVKPLFFELLSVSLFREVEVLCDMVSALGNDLPDKYKDVVAEWVISICKDAHIKDAKLVRSLVMLALRLKLPQEDLLVAEAMVKQMHNVTSRERTSVFESTEASGEFSILCQSTITMATSSILQYIESVVGDIQWTTAMLKICRGIARSRSSFNHDGNSTLLLELEETVYSRAETSVKVLAAFMGMKLKDHQAEQLLKVATKFYKQLALISKLRIAPKGCKQHLPTNSFQSLIDTTCEQLTTPLYDFLVQIQQKQREKDKTKSTINRIKRENNCIPDLIFQIEDYEKYLVQLSKVTKVDVLKHAKHSTSRQFLVFIPNEAFDKDPSNHETDGNDANSCHNESEGDQGTDNEVNPSAESDGLAANISDGEDERIAAKAKRAKRS